MHQHLISNFPSATRRDFLKHTFAAAGGLALGAASTLRAASRAPADLDIQKLLQPVPNTAKFEMDGYFVWCGTMAQSSDGKCHLLFSRWPKTTTFRGWVSHSEVGHAVADTPLGPYRFEGLALKGSGGGKQWDAHMIHNPTLLKVDNKFYLYYTGTHGDEKWEPGKPLGSEDDYWFCRNHQRIGVAVADHPSGPWKRFDQPLLDVEKEGWGTLINSNPSVTPTPDGRFLMIYKTASPGEKRAGKVVHGVAFSESPIGPFKRQPKPVFTFQGAEFPAEDPCVWHDGSRYYAILKDMGGYFTKVGRSLALFESPDGIAWKLSAHALVSTLEIRWADGNVQKVNNLERPFLYRENGVPKVLFLRGQSRSETTALL